MSLVLRDRPRLLPLAAAVAVAEVGGAGAMIKWPNDVLVGGRKVAGILVEGRPAEGWSVLGIGVNVAVAVSDLPRELWSRAGTLGQPVEEIEQVLTDLLERLERWFEAGPDEILGAWRERDALLGREVAWPAGRGVGEGIDGEGRLLVRLAEGGRVALQSGEVHLAG